MDGCGCDPVILFHLGCVWFEDEVGRDMVIHGYWDKDIHDACLVGWMGRDIFLFGWLNETWLG
jgi:hypothetical protein